MCYHGRDTLNTDRGLLTIPGLEAAQVYRVRRHPHMYTPTIPLELYFYKVYHIEMLKILAN